MLGLPALSQIPLRVDCGTFDRFYFATRQFVSQLKTPPAGSFSVGGHDMDYWRRAVARRTRLDGVLAENGMTVRQETTASPP